MCTTNVMSARNARAITLDDDPVARAIGERCASVFAAQGWRGPLNVQCQPDRDGALVIHEFNARFTGATGARWYLGHDEIGAAVRAFTGKSLEPRFPSREASADGSRGPVAPCCRSAIAARAGGARRMEASVAPLTADVALAVRGSGSAIDVATRDDADSPLEIGGELPFEDGAVRELAWAMAWRRSACATRCNC